MINKNWKTISSLCRKIMKNEADSNLAIYHCFENECKKKILFLRIFKAYVETDERAAIEHYKALLFRFEKTTQCIKEVFKVWPPNQVLIIIKKKDNEKILKASIQLDAFILNCHAIFDNIAHIWNETGLENKLNRSKIGITPSSNHQEFIRTLPERFKLFLEKDGIKKAMKLLVDARHSLTHRIPPRVSEIDTDCIANDYPNTSEKKLKTIILEHRTSYFKKLLDGRKPEDLFERYSKFYKIRPIFNLTKSISEDEVTIELYKSCFGHEYIHCFMLETQQLIVWILFEFLMNCTVNLKISVDHKKYLEDLHKEIKSFLVQPENSAPFSKKA